ncbi:NDP-sugar synthase [Candidatus Saganbacteria bacterium]|nr:NDP-sugar synthase [Candidatus Saganbacteria bacterium]
MKALIMAAGYGTRLEPLTLAVPKPMVPIVNWPTMRHNIELLRRHGFRQVTANIHYHPEQIENYFGDGKWLGVDLSYSYEEQLLGTAGGVKRMAELADVKETFLVLSSDALTDINLQQLVDFHKSRRALVTMALSQVKETNHFGVVVGDGQGRITEFQEKSPSEKAKSNWVNTGIYVIEPPALALIPPGPYDFGRQLFPRLAAAEAAIYGCQMNEYWSDVGNLNQYLQSNYDALQGRVHLHLPERSTHFAGTVIGDHCQIGRDVYIKDSVIGDNCVIEDGAMITGSVIWSDTIIGAESVVDRTVVGSWCHLEAGVKVEAGAVIANRSLIHKGRLVPAGARLEPNSIQ